MERTCVKASHWTNRIHKRTRRNTSSTKQETKANGYYIPNSIGLYGMLDLTVTSSGCKWLEMDRGVRKRRLSAELVQETFQSLQLPDRTGDSADDPTCNRVSPGWQTGHNVSVPLGTSSSVSLSSYDNSDLDNSFHLQVDTLTNVAPFDQGKAPGEVIDTRLCSPGRDHNTPSPDNIVDIYGNTKTAQVEVFNRTVSNLRFQMDKLQKPQTTTSPASSVHFPNDDGLQCSTMRYTRNTVPQSSAIQFPNNDVRPPSKGQSPTNNVFRTSNTQFAATDVRQFSEIQLPLDNVDRAQQIQYSKKTYSTYQLSPKYQDPFCFMSRDENPSPSHRLYQVKPPCKTSPVNIHNYQSPTTSTVQSDILSISTGSCSHMAEQIQNDPKVYTKGGSSRCLSNTAISNSSYLDSNFQKLASTNRKQSSSANSIIPECAFSSLRFHPDVFHGHQPSSVPNGDCSTTWPGTMESGHTASFISTYSNTEQLKVVVSEHHSHSASSFPDRRQSHQQDTGVLNSTALTEARRETYNPHLSEMNHDFSSVKQISSRSSDTFHANHYSPAIDVHCAVSSVSPLPLCKMQTLLSDLDSTKVNPILGDDNSNRSPINDEHSDGSNVGSQSSKLSPYNYNSTRFDNDLKEDRNNYNSVNSKTTPKMVQAETATRSICYSDTPTTRVCESRVPIASALCPISIDVHPIPSDIHCSEPDRSHLTTETSCRQLTPANGTTHVCDGNEESYPKIASTNGCNQAYHSDKLNSPVNSPEITSIPSSPDTFNGNIPCRYSARNNVYKHRVISIQYPDGAVANLNSESQHREGTGEVEFHSRREIIQVSDIVDGIFDDIMHSSKD